MGLRRTPQQKKLKIRRETIRRLDTLGDEELRRAAGGDGGEMVERTTRGGASAIRRSPDRYC